MAIPASWTIHTWWSETAPNASKGIARIQIPGISMDGRNRIDVREWHPVVFHAPTQDEARARAVAWIEDEIEKAEAKANRPKKGGRPKKTENAIDELPEEAL